ncbi:MAG: hypothetical protein K8U03_13140 [Planctomycetia bacterium]|nr:hypothetical protein [Planctomycetia bacterium]
MDLKADIISGKSIAGIGIGEDIGVVLSNLRDDHVSFVESAFENHEMGFKKLDIADAKVSVIANDTGRIVRLFCRPGYLGKYKAVFFPGMSVKRIRQHSSKQLIMHGVLMVNDDYGAGFSIPDLYEGKQYDDVDHIAELPDGMILEELNVMASEWWR